MKILSVLVFIVCFALFNSDETGILRIPVAKPYELNFYADQVGPTPTKIVHAFLFGLLYDAPPISR